MGRDRAKEKIQAHRKARLERKEAKTEQRGKHEVLRKLSLDAKTKKTDCGDLINAILDKNWEMLESLLEKDENVNYIDFYGHTPLVRAALCLDWSEALFNDLWELMERKVDIDVYSANLEGVTLVHALCFRGWTSVLKKLLDFMENAPVKKCLRDIVNSVMNDGSTPLMLAVDNKDEETCQLLLSKGANPLTQDKTGWTPVCRSLSNEITFISEGHLEIPPIFRLLLSAVEDSDCDWDFETYIIKTVQNVSNPGDQPFFCERFHRCGRFVFLFILRCVNEGPDLLLKSKIFSKLCSAGQKNLGNINFVNTICLTWFEILSYSEDFEDSWSQYVMSFINDGAADFCIKLLQRFTSLETGIDEEMKEQSKSSTFSDDIEYKLRTQWDTDNSVAVTALMPFVQLIDAVGMDGWFSRHFQTLSTCYKRIKDLTKPMKTALSAGHAAKINKKIAVFHSCMYQECWQCLYHDKRKSKKAFEKSQKDRTAKILSTEPPSHLIQFEQNDDESQSKCLPNLVVDDQNEFKLLENCKVNSDNFQKTQDSTASKDSTDPFSKIKVGPYNRLAIPENLENSTEVLPVRKDNSIAQISTPNKDWVMFKQDSTKCEHLCKKSPSREQLEFQFSDIRHLERQFIDLMEDMLLQDGWSTCYDLNLWRLAKKRWAGQYIFSPHIHCKVSDLHTIVEVLANDEDARKNQNWIEQLGPNKETEFEEYDLVTRAAIVLEAVSNEYLSNIFMSAFTYDNPINILPVYIFAERNYQLFGMRRWARTHFSEKYLFKNMEKISMNEIFQDFLNSYPITSHFGEGPQWTAYGLVKKENVQDKLVYIVSVLGNTSNLRLDSGNQEHNLYQKVKKISVYNKAIQFKVFQRDVRVPKGMFSEKGKVTYSKTNFSNNHEKNMPNQNSSSKSNQKHYQEDKVNAKCICCD